jgi:hypothetical protein
LLLRLDLPHLLLLLLLMMILVLLVVLLVVLRCASPRGESILPPSKAEAQTA